LVVGDIGLVEIEALGFDAGAHGQKRSEIKNRR
jgi:hypothetical protein